ncbi:MAG: response regulator transcription factor, partial [Proteobacteria bacterium]|nr:response regulator transcription factor [Pseudomonadota bacterium]
MIKSILYVVIADDTLRKSMGAELPNDYDVSFYDLVETVLTNDSGIQPNIILCHQDLLGSDEAILLASLKTNYPDSNILVIGPSRPIEVQIEALKHGARGYFD